MKLSIKDLYSTHGLKRLYKRFIDLYPNLTEDIIQNAISVEKFLAEIFDIKENLEKTKNQIINLEAIYKCKKLFIERIALKKKQKPEEFSVVLKKIHKIFAAEEIKETTYAKKVLHWLQDKENFKKELNLTADYALHMIKNQNSVLFSVPKKLNFENLIELKKNKKNNLTVLEAGDFKIREGFSLTDGGLKEEEIRDQTDYCLICHERKKDSCRTGFFDKKTEEFRLSKTGVTLRGCPLDQKISEVNKLYRSGNAIAALCVITLDNPMCAATGHRICNDCMRSCIYQKQEPVNVPGIETGILDSVLKMPYGFEIYSLLTRWNPLNNKNPIPKADSGYKVFVSGLGPAGFTLCHYLLNQGHTVVATDGAKIEPLTTNLSGVLPNGTKTDFELIKDTSSIFENLKDRVIGGFGGVAEYGITVRWNKNYLKIIRLLLERRPNFYMFGGVRFGGNINFQDLKNLNFDHLALCVGAGRPNLPSVKNILTRGVRFASDFLMNLQLGGAFQKNSISNLQIRMPIVVIGAGLTAVDSATECLTYYKVQVKKFFKRYKELVKKFGKENVENSWTEEEKIIATEFIDHAKKIDSAKNSTEFLKNIGGAKIVYRKTLQESPAYKLNFEELKSAFSEGIEFIENTQPIEVLKDEFGSVIGLKCKQEDQEITILAKTILIATGTKPNDVLAQEYASEYKNLKDISFFGDLDKKYSGSVVGAMASAKDKYQKITEKLLAKSAERKEDFASKICDLLNATVVKVNELSEKIFEIIVYAPLAAKNFKPGQFYKLQNFESSFDQVGFRPNIQIEPIALTGAMAQKSEGILSLIVLEVGASSYLCKFLKPGQPVVLMGPTGSPTNIPKNKNVLLIGGGLGNAVLFSIAEAMKQNRCKITYFAGYKKVSDRFKREEIEKHSDTIVWVCDESKIEVSRSQDKSLNCNMIEALDLYTKNKIKMPNKINEIDSLLTIGSDSLMHAVQSFILKNRSKFKYSLKAIASINSPMQCMMKEICGQCIQKNLNKAKESYIYSCNQQDQDIFDVDFDFLNQRLRQNSLWEKLNYFYVKSLI